MLRLCGLVFQDGFSCPFVISGVAHVCLFHVKEAFSPPKHAIHPNTYRDAKGLRRNLRGG